MHITIFVYGSWGDIRPHVVLGMALQKAGHEVQVAAAPGYEQWVRAHNLAYYPLTADVNTIDTDNEQRDGHLKNADFFDAAKFPSLTFKSTSIKKVADKKFKLVGDLTLHGVTKSVTLDLTLGGTGVHPYTKKTIAGFKATGTLKRSDFGIGAGTPSSAVSDEVELTANGEFSKD